MIGNASSGISYQLRNFRELEYQILMLKDAFFTSFSLIAEGGFQLSTFHIYSNIPAAQEYM
jgi:hypothetical protein